MGGSCSRDDGCGSSCARAHEELTGRREHYDTAGEGPQPVMPAPWLDCGVLEALDPSQDPRSSDTRRAGDRSSAGTSAGLELEIAPRPAKSTSTGQELEIAPRWAKSTSAGQEHPGADPRSRDARRAGGRRAAGTSKGLELEIAAAARGGPERGARRSLAPAGRERPGARQLPRNSSRGPRSCDARRASDRRQLGGSWPAGSWAVEGKAVGFLVKKGQGKSQEYSFCVAALQSGAGDDWAFWESQLKPAGKTGDGREKFKLCGHPDGGFFVRVDDETFSECDKEMNERCVWKYRDEIKGKFLTSIAAPPQAAKNYPTDNFSQAVIHKDPSRNEPCSPPTEVIVEACLGRSELPTDPKERQRVIANCYTSESPLYHEMNTALRNDDLSALRYYSAFIKELRDVFKTDHVDQIIEPFVGKVWRGITFPDPEAAMKDFPVGGTFVWSAFTSMTTDRDVAFNFGNVVFEVSCLPPKEAYEGMMAVYAPASVQSFSDFDEEAEILFPPNIQFEVKEIKMPGDDDEDCSPLIICETVAFDSDEGIKEFQAFKKMFDEAMANGELDLTPPDRRLRTIRAGYKRLFDAIDDNSSGTLSKKEMRRALTKVQGAVAYAGTVFPGISMPGEDGISIRKYVNEMFKASDMNHDGTLSFEEMMGFFGSKHESPDAMAAAFAAMTIPDWTQIAKTISTLARAFEEGDFDMLG